MNLNFSSKKIKNSLSKKAKGIFSGIKKTIKKTNKIKRNTRAFILKNRRRRIRRKKFEAERRRLSNKKTLNKKGFGQKVKNFGTNIIKAVTFIFAGWLIKNLPNIIKSIKELIKKINRIVDVSRIVFDSFVKNFETITRQLAIFTISMGKIDFTGATKGIPKELKGLSTEFKKIKRLADEKIRLLNKTKKNQGRDFLKSKKKITPKQKKIKNLNLKNKYLKNFTKLRGGQSFKNQTTAFQAPNIPMPKEVRVSNVQRFKNLFRLRNIRTSIKNFNPKQAAKGPVNMIFDYILTNSVMSLANMVNDELFGINKKVNERVKKIGFEDAINLYESQILILEEEQKRLNGILKFIPFTSASRSNNIINHNIEALERQINKLERRSKKEQNNTDNNIQSIEIPFTKQIDSNISLSGFSGNSFQPITGGTNFDVIEDKIPFILLEDK